MHGLCHFEFISLALLSLLSHLVILTAQSDFLSYWCYPDKGNYTSTSTYNTNLNTVLSDLTSNTKIDYGYYNSSYGQNPDRVNALGLCRGDFRQDSCLRCLNYAIINLRQLCPYQKEAFGRYENCLLIYSNRSIFGIDESPDFYVFTCDPYNATDVNKYNEVLGGLMQSLRSQAAAGDSRRKFAADKATTLSQTIWGLVQCMPDLSEQDCDDCLGTAISNIPNFCKNRLGGMILKLSCNIRYEYYRFYDTAVVDSLRLSPPPSLAPPTNTTSSQGKRDSTGSQVVVMIILLVIGSVTVSVTLFCLGCYMLRRKTRKGGLAILRENFGEESSNLKSLRFSLATIEVATNKFSVENKIGKGGFGEVYKGILPDGREIAVKRLSRSSGQGALEFKNEILLIAKLQHRNLVALLGFCLEEQEKILIYEYVPNKSIDCFLFDSKKQRLLNWSERIKIIGGIARGLLYLHEHSRLKVIHRDLKLSNVLLDNKMNPKISDFGMARMVAIDEEQGSTNRIVGTYGYMPPEYLIHGQFSEKSDVFSFGVIILEIISGKRNAKSYESHLLTDVWKQWNDGTPLQVLDSILMESCSRTEVIKYVQIGLLCVQRNPDDRPTMAQIVLYLSNLSIELPTPREPAFFMHPNPTMVAESSQSSKPTSLNEISKSEFLPR